jgi:predicted GNAT family acetyltransferase
VRVAAKYRGQKICAWMMQEAIQYAKSKGASIIQLTTNKQRTSGEMVNSCNAGKYQSSKILA